jgi:hypothetical protein
MRSVRVLDVPPGGDPDRTMRSAFFRRPAERPTIT